MGCYTKNENEPPMFVDQSQQHIGSKKLNPSMSLTGDACDQALRYDNGHTQNHELGTTQRRGASSALRRCGALLPHHAPAALRQCAIRVGEQTVDIRAGGPADASHHFKLSFSDVFRSQQRTTSVT
jgi:hypothetical protein